MGLLRDDAPPLRQLVAEAQAARPCPSITLLPRLHWEANMISPSVRQQSFFFVRGAFFVCGYLAQWEAGIPVSGYLSPIMNSPIWFYDVPSL